MKKLLSIAAIASAFVAFGATGTEFSVGSVGVTAIDSPATNTIIAVSYEDLAGGNIAISNIVKTQTLTVGDQMAVFNNGEYDTWTLTAGSGGANYWAKNDKTFIASGAGIIEGDGTPANIITKSVGSGLWIVQKGDTIKPIYLYGKPASETNSTTTAGTWTLIGNPKQTAVSPDDLTFSGISNLDTLVVVGTDGKLVYYSYNSTGKEFDSKIRHWRRNVKNAWTYDAPDIGAGLGCWIKTKQAATVQW